MKYIIYKIFNITGTWMVFSCYYEDGKEDGKLVKHDIVYNSNDVANCYAWIKAKEEGLLGDE